MFVQKMIDQPQTLVAVGVTAPTQFVSHDWNDSANATAMRWETSQQGQWTWCARRFNCSR